MDLFNSNTIPFVDRENLDSNVDPYFAGTRKIYDPIHNFIVYDQKMWNFIDTCEFQRLRDIRQLGGVAFVFQGATHTRFEHCLGTGYLAQKQVNSIFKYQPDIVAELGPKENASRVKSNITLAGLLHDLGHALFSHLFDGKVIPKLCPSSEWCHEKGSAMLVDRLIENNHIDIEKEDSEMIKDLILGNSTKSAYKEMRWIFDIVANKRNSIDVDKFDYMIRDSYHLGLKDTSFDYRALMKESRVIDDEICFPAKLCHKVYELFQARYKLYKGIYHNRAAEAIELMITEALINANPYYRFDQAINDPEEYMRLTDHIIQEIEYSKTPELEKSRQIIMRIRKRDTYKFVYETIIESNFVLPEEERMKIDILSYAKNDGLGPVLGLEDFEICTGTNNFALKDKNPVECVKFYNKSNIKKSFIIDKEQVSLLLPSKFSERFLRMYVKDSRQLEKAKDAFQKYCKNSLNARITPIESKNFISTPSKLRTNPADENSSFEPQLRKKLFIQREEHQEKSPLFKSHTNN